MCLICCLVYWICCDLSLSINSAIMLALVFRLPFEKPLQDMNSPTDLSLAQIQPHDRGSEAVYSRPPLLKKLLQRYRLSFVGIELMSLVEAKTLLLACTGWLNTKQLVTPILFQSIYPSLQVKIPRVCSRLSLIFGVSCDWLLALIGHILIGQNLIFS